MRYTLAELNAMSEEQLRSLGESMNIKGAKKMDLMNLGFEILDEQARSASQKSEAEPEANTNKPKKRGRPKKEKADEKSQQPETAAASPAPAPAPKRGRKPAAAKEEKPAA